MNENITMAIIFGLRWLERVGALAAGVALVISGLKYAHSKRRKSAKESNHPPNRDITIKGNVQSGEFLLALKNYGPAVVLVAFGIIIVISVYVSHLEIKKEGPLEIWHYAEQNPQFQQLLPLLSPDDMEELRTAAEELHQQRPSESATIRLLRVYKNIYNSGRLTPDQAQRMQVLLGQPSLKPEERAELRTLRARYGEELQPSW